MIEADEVSTVRLIEPDARWMGLVGVYGGWVAALFADTAAEAGFALASLEVRFTAGVELAEMALHRTPMHRGRRSASTGLRLEQHGRVRAEGVAVHVRRDAPPEKPAAGRRDDTTPPQSHRARPHAQGDLAYARNLDVRTAMADPDQSPPATWLKLASSPAPLGLHSGAAIASVLLDALMPVVFRSENPPAFVPTIEFAFSFSPGVDAIDENWCVAENRLDWVDGEFCAEDASLRHAASGQLLARVRQLRSIRHSL